MEFLKRRWHQILSLYVAFIFVQSLFFKFTNAPETVYIFEEKLEPWASSFGFSGLFAPGGLFSANVVGSMELLASALILTGASFDKMRLAKLLGALLGLGVISGAITFHLFTPLGIAMRNADGSSDGGQLFIAACSVWISCALLATRHRSTLRDWLR